MKAIKRFVKSRLSAGLRAALRDLKLEIYFARRHRAGVRRARGLASSAPQRLNLGSGFRRRAGWINVDLGDQADVTLDLRRPLPFATGSVEAIYSEHFFEHLDYGGADDSEARTFLRECRRVLSPGGLLDVVVPDAAGIVEEYVRRFEQPFPKHAWWGPNWCDTPLHCVNYVFRQGREHKYAYDEETLGRVLEQEGFVDVRRRAFDPDVDAPNHAIGSLSIHARKPAADTDGPA
jgi:predicted SAM-dependent methyltransferase